MTITRAQALRLLEPFWLARAASQERLDAMLEEVLRQGTREALAQAEALQRAGRYLQEKARRLDPAFLLQAIQSPEGEVLLFPEVKLHPRDAESLVAQWRERQAEPSPEAAAPSGAAGALA